MEDMDMKLKKKKLSSHPRNSRFKAVNLFHFLLMLCVPWMTTWPIVGRLRLRPVQVGALLQIVH